jgi:sulfatase-like protein
MAVETLTGARRGWAALVVALVLLNASLTFENLWPTPWVRWDGALSLELAICVLLWTAVSRWTPGRPGSATRWLTVIWMLLVFGRYAQVTTPALYGREINLYWDLRFIPEVVAMVARVVPVWLVTLVAAAVALALTLSYRVLRWAFRQLARAMGDARARQTLALVSAAVILLFAAQRMNARTPRTPEISTPATVTYVRQIQLITEALAGSRSLPDSPAMTSDLAVVKDAAVFLVFVESYGAVSYDRREFADALSESRTQLLKAIRETNRDVVSAYVESPTFGGSSWLAHVSLMTGIEVRDEDVNTRVMIQRRDTLVHAFSRGGYRTVALMPGLWHSWPEGAFYGFDEIYGAVELDYHGPAFGWYMVPDQFSLGRLDALEARRASRAPLFVFFPTISSHFPFSPTPPYQPDWERITDAHPYDRSDMMNAYLDQPDLINFGPDYVRALAYNFTAIGGYLRKRADQDIVMIIIGDHQPAAAVTGEGASWDVPVHVTANRREVLDRLVARGFRPGLTPVRPRLGAMHTLLPVLLQAFGEPGPSIGHRAPGGNLGEKLR